ncbi:hypothetical protein ACHQM5_019705 [Ranunculus cassubicifolius]
MSEPNDFLDIVVDRVKRFNDLKLTGARPKTRSELWAAWIFSVVVVLGDGESEATSPTLDEEALGKFHPAKNFNFCVASLCWTFSRVVMCNGAVVLSTVWQEKKSETPSPVITKNRSSGVSCPTMYKASQQVYRSFNCVSLNNFRVPFSL